MDQNKLLTFFIILCIGIFFIYIFHTPPKVVNNKIKINSNDILIDKEKFDLELSENSE